MPLKNQKGKPQWHGIYHSGRFLLFAYCQLHFGTANQWWAEFFLEKITSGHKASSDLMRGQSEWGDRNKERKVWNLAKFQVVQRREKIGRNRRKICYSFSLHLFFVTVLFINKGRSVKDCLPHKMQRAVLAAKEKGASSWLTALPWRISDSRFPTVTPGTLYIYVMVGPRPDYQRLVFVANLFTSTMLYRARIEGTWDSGTTRYGTCLGKYWKILVLTSASSRPWSPLRVRSSLRRQTALKTPGWISRLVVSGEWAWHERAYFDVRVFYPHAHSHCHRSLPQIYRSKEMEKRRQYQERILNVDGGTFTSLVFFCDGRCRSCCKYFSEALGRQDCNEEVDHVRPSLTMVEMLLVVCPCAFKPPLSAWGKIYPAIGFSTRATPTWLGHGRGSDKICLGFLFLKQCI